ncbi:MULTISPECIES: hypothetical protein [Pseudomonas fluorescens group]|uniref:Uncharacterized protein n=1 Tax=Pseudomonas azotoformans TaxID=47878 RepID=A0A4Q0HW77_PSEAZ|nr:MULTISPECIES: hypothetical protein [Pseudomonas fluorescens group]RXE52109.1 hypothetical protein B4O85_12085 [Pseudomonas azotoformans]
MRKDKITIEDIDTFDDYKMEYVWERTKLDMESRDGWLYLGADASNPSFAKLGLTMGDLISRSYSSGNPNYYLFCAFKCRHDISLNELKIVENNILNRLEDLYRYSDGSTKRMRFYESRILSECFCDVNFIGFFQDLHYEIYENYRSYFVISGMDDGFGGTDGEFVDCLFSPTLSDPHFYRKMIIQY